MKRPLLLVSAFALQTACYHYRVAAPQVSNLSEPVRVTQWSYLWGAIQSTEVNTSCRCLNNGIKEVTASTNLAYLLLGVATLGMLVPTELTYVCAKPPVGGKWPDPPKQCGFPVLPAPALSGLPREQDPPPRADPLDADGGDF